MDPDGSTTVKKEKPQIWWSNGIFFIGMSYESVFFSGIS